MQISMNLESPMLSKNYGCLMTIIDHILPNGNVQQTNALFLDKLFTDSIPPSSLPVLPVPSLVFPVFVGGRCS